MLRFRYLLLALLALSIPASAATKKKKRPRKPAAVTTPVVREPVEPEPILVPPGQAAPPTATVPATPMAAPPSTTPAPPPPPPPPAETTTPAPAVRTDFDSLKAEYDALRDELFRSRARANFVGQALFKTRLAVWLEYQAQRAWPLKRVTLKLDDQPIYAADTPDATRSVRLYDGFVAGGRHTLEVRLDCVGHGTERVAYGAAGTFVIDVADGKQTRVELVADETGDGPEHLAGKKSGRFDVRLRAGVEKSELEKK